MPSNHPPQRRPIEIVPLGEPVHATPLPVAAESAAGAWPVPTVRSTAHPPIAAGEPLIDLTATAAATPVATGPPHSAEAAVPAGAPGATAGWLVLGKRRERLRDLIAREREELEHTASVVALPHPGADVAPFPLPTVSTVAPAAPDTGTAATDLVQPALRRAPKAVRPDAAGRPLADDVAAAIARLAGRAPGEDDAVPATERDRRIEIVPLEDPTPDATVVPLPVSEVIDLRERLAGSASTTPRCPACDHPGELDLVDRINGLARYGCAHCFRIWSRPLA
jgi:hypothetical protein